MKRLLLILTTLCSLAMCLTHINSPLLGRGKAAKVNYVVNGYYQMYVPTIKNDLAFKVGF